MSYEPTTWKDGDLVTSIKLNKMEQGIANSGGMFVVNIEENDDTMTLDKTWQEIYDAAPNVIFSLEAEDEKQILYLSNIMIGTNNGSNDTAYLVIIGTLDGQLQTLGTFSPDDYPTNADPESPQDPDSGVSA